QGEIRRQPTWTRVTHDVSGFALPDAITPWGFPIAVTMYRKKVRHRTAKNFQLDLFDPNDGYYEYSAVASNLPLMIRNLWHFMAGRGNHEKTIGQLKTGLAFHTEPTNAYAANIGGQQPVALAPQPTDQLSNRYGRPRAETVAQTHRAPLTPDRTDAAVRAVPSRRDPCAPKRQNPVTTHEQSGDARTIYAARTSISQGRLSF